MRCNKNNKCRNLLLLLSVMLLSACASSPPKVSSIEERARARWDAILSDDLAGAYEYLSPGYRSSVSSNQYQRSILLKRVQWISAEYKGSECAEAICNVDVLLGYRLVGALPGVKSYESKRDIQESWILVAGQWYHVPES